MCVCCVCIVYIIYIPFEGVDYVVGFLVPWYPGSQCSDVVAVVSVLVPACCQMMLAVEDQ